MDNEFLIDELITDIRRSHAKDPFTKEAMENYLVDKLTNMSYLGKIGVLEKLAQKLETEKDGASSESDTMDRKRNVIDIIYFFDEDENKEIKSVDDLLEEFVSGRRSVDEMKLWIEKLGKVVYEVISVSKEVAVFKTSRLLKKMDPQKIYEETQGFGIGKKRLKKIEAAFYACKEQVDSLEYLQDWEDEVAVRYKKRFQNKGGKS